MDATTTFSVETEAIWAPTQPLPLKNALRDLADRIGARWGIDDLNQQVRVVYNPRLTTTLGRAILNRGVVELNPRLLAEHPSELIPTLVHELAHIVVHMRFGRVAPHGHHFKMMMGMQNLSARSTHSLPVAHLRRKRKKYLYLHTCSECGYRFVARSFRRSYYCASCGPDMKWDVYRTSNTAAGQKLIKRLCKAK
ncbi:MAG: SprT-like domain-containing protein [Phycisphaerae bacterium]|nr:SprT-like domain-containing protein [Phycisphaerae bacterium]